MIEQFLEPVVGYWLELSFCRTLTTVTFKVSTELLAMDEEMNHDDASQILWKNILEQKKEYSKNIPDLYKIIISVSAVMLTLVTTLYPQTGLQSNLATLLRATVFLMLLNIVFGLTALYGRYQVHLDKVNSIILEVKRLGAEKALESLSNPKNSLIFQKKIYAWSHYLSVICFLASFVLLAWFAILRIG